MFDDIFAFIDPIVELSEDDTRFVIQAEAFYDFWKKSAWIKKHIWQWERQSRYRWIS